MSQDLESEESQADASETYSATVTVVLKTNSTRDLASGSLHPKKMLQLS